VSRHPHAASGRAYMGRSAAFPFVRDGFESFPEAINNVCAGATSGRLRVTAASAYAGRWLVPRLPRWREAHPRLKLDIVGTDCGTKPQSLARPMFQFVMSESLPTEGPSVELVRDTFFVVASPKLVGNLRRPLSPVDLGSP